MPLNLLQTREPDGANPYHSHLVRNLNGMARLQTLLGPPDIEIGSGYLHRRETILVLDDEPLLRRHTTECPTCEQLLQAGCRSPAAARQFADAINALTIDQVAGPDATWLSALEPIFDLLPTDNYVVGLRQLFPTDGEGHFFWSRFNRLTSCWGLSAVLETCVPRATFLAPTQSTAAFRPDSLARIAAGTNQTPALGLALDGWMAALLDGHHRALHAALSQRPLFTLTIAATYSLSPPEIRQRQFVEQSQIDELLRQIHSVPVVELPPEQTPGDLRLVYPDLESVMGLQLLGDGSTISDEVIQKVLAERWDHGYTYCGTIRYLLKALSGTRDPRAISAGMAILRNHNQCQYWELAFRTLAGFRCPEVEDFFIAFLCRDHDPPRTELTRIADAYLSTQS